MLCPVLFVVDFNHPNIDPSQRPFPRVQSVTMHFRSAYLLFAFKAKIACLEKILKQRFSKDVLLEIISWKTKVPVENKVSATK